MSDKNAAELKQERDCNGCHAPMPQGIRTLVDTDDGLAEVCACGHAQRAE